MQFTFTPMDEADARQILSWRYEDQYAVYNSADSESSLTEILDRRSPYYAVHNAQNELIGFFCFGTSAQVLGYAVPALYSEDATIDIGLGMRPNLTGNGQGLAFVQAGLDFAREQFAPRRFRLFVLKFNERAMRVYERVGFARVRELTRPDAAGDVTFVEMQREV